MGALTLAMGHAVLCVALRKNTFASRPRLIYFMSFYMNIHMYIYTASFLLYLLPSLFIFPLPGNYLYIFRSPTSFSLLSFCFFLSLAHPPASFLYFSSLLHSFIAEKLFVMFRSFPFPSHRSARLECSFWN